MKKTINDNKTKRILIFPSGMPESIAFYKSHTDCSIFGASAIAEDPSNSIYDQWTYLPYVDTDEFDQSLLTLLATIQPDEIYCPHRFASHYVNNLLDKHHLDIKLISNKNEKLDSFERKQADAHYAAYNLLVNKFDVPIYDRLSYTEINAVVKHALSIPGETGVDKIINILGIAALIPPGDLVEIGCLYGRTAFVMAWLARRLNKGNLLCIDPWSTDAAIHQDTSPTAREAIKENYNYDSIFQEFKENLLCSFYQSVNYIRDTSNNAINLYPKSDTISSPEFGDTQYTHTIACLHIDGNHDFSAVYDDVVNWAAYLKPNGWLIIDDYNWPFGDGPKKVADEILKTHEKTMDTFFIAGDALFIRLKQKFDTDILFIEKKAS